MTAASVPSTLRLGKNSGRQCSMRVVMPLRLLFRAGRVAGNSSLLRLVVADISARLTPTPWSHLPCLSNRDYSSLGGLPHAAQEVRRLERDSSRPSSSLRRYDAVQIRRHLHHTFVFRFGKRRSSTVRCCNFTGNDRLNFRTRHHRKGGSGGDYCLIAASYTGHISETCNSSSAPDDRPMRPRANYPRPYERLVS